MDALELAAGNGQIAWLLGAAGEHDGVVIGEELFGRDIDADMGAVMKDDAFAVHLHDAAFDVMLLHLEVGNAVSEKPTRLGIFFIDVNVVADARQLLCAGHAGRPGADAGDFLAGLRRRRLRFEPGRDGAVGDRAFDRFDSDRIVVDVERA